MIPEIGHLALILALCLALVQGVLPLLGAARGIPGWVAVARPAARGQFLFLALAFLCLTYAFITHDFSVSYVARNSSTLLPLGYRITAVWGAHEGSLLLWALLLGGWSVAVTYLSRGLPEPLTARVVAVMGLVSVGFLLFLLLTSNPFVRLLPAPPEGRDLNPLLQDPGLALHPPLLYLGYVGFAVPFAMAIAALLDGRLDAAWARWSRPWSTVAWVFLTLGITLGSWWAYYELGWGGWWFWDPVENASLMPWLAGTALIHSLAVTEKRGALRTWTVLLALLAFALSLLGTFLVRSGVLVSVHAFAADPARGLFILLFLALVVGASLALYAWRAPTVRGGAGFAPVSREGLLLANNVLLVVALATILLGTLYPLALDALGLGKISVGPPYFDSVFVPLMLPLVLLTGLGPLLRWRASSLREAVLRLRPAFGISLLIGFGLPLLMAGRAQPLVSLAVALGCWVILAALQDLWRRSAGRRAPASLYGMAFAHVGLGVFVLGVTLAQTYGIERDVRLGPGEAVELAGYRFELAEVRRLAGPNYEAERGLIRVTRAGAPVTVLEPEKRHYPVQGMPMTEAAIDGGLWRDLYVALGEPLGKGAWSVRIYYKPLQRWIWIGPLLMALGGMLAAVDRRYRLVLSRRTHAGAPVREGGL